MNFTPKGIVVPIVTPVDQDGNLNEKAYRGLIDYLADNGIHSANDLADSIADLSQQITALETQRQKCRNQLRRNTDPARETALKGEAKAISKELVPLREKLRTAQRIALRYPEIQKTLETERAMEMTARARERERS